MTPDVETKKCPECVSTQVADVKYCSQCAHSFCNSEENVEQSEISRSGFFNRAFSYIAENRKPILIYGGIILAIWYFIPPAPYSLRYLTNRALFTPTAQCRDGVYSFSSSRSGTCSNHGGVKRWNRK